MLAHSPATAVECAPVEDGQPPLQGGPDVGPGVAEDPDACGGRGAVPLASDPCGDPLLKKTVGRPVAL